MANKIPRKGLRAKELANRIWNRIIGSGAFIHNSYQMEALVQSQLLPHAHYANLPIEVFANNLCQRAGGFLLDIACGIGYFTNYLSTCNPQVKIVALDASLDHLLTAKRSYANRNILLVQARAENLPFSVNTFSAISCTRLTFHLSEEQTDQVLRESQRVLISSGDFLFVDTLYRAWGPLIMWVSQFVERYEKFLTAHFVRVSFQAHEWSFVKEEADLLGLKAIKVGRGFYGLVAPFWALTNKRLARVMIEKGVGSES